ncbi:MAG: hypothetical protein ACOZCL_09365 [Bacillota bacterium]
MSDKTRGINGFCDELVYKDMKLLIDILVPLINSYRLLVGAADEFNKISLANKHDVEEAIDRADDLGEIIDDIQDELHKIMRYYLNEMQCKLKSGMDSGFDSDYINTSKIQIVEEE